MAWLFPLGLLAAGISHLLYHWLSERSDTRRSVARIERWAEEHRYELLGMERRQSGPFQWYWHSGMGIYRVAVADAEGDIKGGWIRCTGGRLFWSKAQDELEVHWDE